MLIRSKKDWELPESVVTAEDRYRRRNRRDFLKHLGVGTAGALLGGHSLFGASGGFPSSANPAYLPGDLKVTPYDLITSYNNFYEFGLGKDEPKVNANMGWMSEPWTVEIGGQVRNPLKLDVNELIKKVGGIEQRVYRHRCVEAWSMVVPWDGFALSKLVALADPKPEAKFLQMTTFFDPKNVPGQRKIGRASCRERVYTSV
jgi:sulfoxide reductase catalytic subunit YedY